MFIFRGFNASAIVVKDLPSLRAPLKKECKSSFVMSLLTSALVTSEQSYAETHVAPASLLEVMSISAGGECPSVPSLIASVSFMTDLNSSDGGFVQGNVLLIAFEEI